ncbi:hypothetical protein M0804_000208 [Polistes exclamans]|nr:hypothetical protein M0804_000208 [Polistes exclamans]
MQGTNRSAVRDQRMSKFGCPDSGPRATRMPTDDDYGRRERHLLHQHPIAHEYGVSRERVTAIDRHDKSTDKSSIEDYGKSNVETRSVQSSCERFGHYQNQERFGQSGLQAHHQYTGRQTSSGQSLSQNILVDRFARFTDLSNLHAEQRLSIPSGDRFQVANGGELRFHHVSNDPGLASTNNEYANANVLVSSCTSSSFSSETFPSPPSPAPANDRFVPPPPLSPSPSEKYASSQSLAGYPPADRILPPGSPGARYGGGTAPASPMPTKDRFVSSERLLANQQQSSCNATSMHDVKDQQQQRYTGNNGGDRLLSGSSPVLGALQTNLQIDRNILGNYVGSGKDSPASRYTTISTERLLSASPIHAPVPERFAGKSSDRYGHGESPIHERYHRSQQETSSSLHHDRYSSIATSSERFFPLPTSNNEGTHQRYSTTERSLQVPNANDQNRRLYADRAVEVVCQKYSERSNGSNQGGQGQGGGGGGGSGGNGNAEYGRYSNFHDVRFNELVIQRSCGQARGNERYSVGGVAYLAASSPGHEVRSSNVAETSSSSRYVVSDANATERILAATSSSPSSSSETGTRYHSPYTNANGIQSSSAATVNDRFSSISPTPETSGSVLRGTVANAGPNGTYQSSSKNGGDKFLQVSKSVQSYATDRYSLGNEHQFDRPVQDRYDRFPASGSSNDRFSSSTTTPDRFHPPSDRYSPARSVPDKYLSLPKPKDRFTGRIAPISSCATSSVVPTSTDRPYGSSSTGTYVPPTAHTPVERYVPQPPPEVLYPDRYVDRYVPPVAHTPTDRYVPTNDPGDPYMRRDLGFHHHYRLPPPAGYPYHQAHFRFRGFAYASPARLGGSPGSSSSSSSATSNQRGAGGGGGGAGSGGGGNAGGAGVVGGAGGGGGGGGGGGESFSTSPLLRPKLRTSAVEFTTNSAGIVARHVCANPPSCCNEATNANGQRPCCQPIRRSLPPGALPSIPAQSTHSSW